MRIEIQNGNLVIDGYVFNEKPTLQGIVDAQGVFCFELISQDKTFSVKIYKAREKEKVLEFFFSKDKNDAGVLAVEKHHKIAQLNVRHKEKIPVSYETMNLFKDLTLQVIPRKKLAEYLQKETKEKVENAFNSLIEKENKSQYTFGFYETKELYEQRKETPKGTQITIIQKRFIDKPPNKFFYSTLPFVFLALGIDQKSDKVYFTPSRITDIYKIPKDKLKETPRIYSEITNAMKALSTTTHYIENKEEGDEIWGSVFGKIKFAGKKKGSIGHVYLNKAYFPNIDFDNGQAIAPYREVDTSLLIKKDFDFETPLRLWYLKLQGGLNVGNSKHGVKFQTLIKESSASSRDIKRIETQKKIRDIFLKLANEFGYNIRTQKDRSGKILKERYFMVWKGNKSVD